MISCLMELWKFIVRTILNSLLGLSNKGDVYKLLVSARKLPYGIRCSERKLAKILALFTNLTDSPFRETRIKSIRCNYKYYKRIYK